MKWFEHQTDCEFNKKFQKLEMHYQAQGGDGDGFFAAYGRVWRLYEIIGRLGEERTNQENFDLPEDFTLELLAFRLKCSLDYLTEFLSALAEVGLIDKAAWQERQKVYAPKLQERADTYTKRKNRLKTGSEESFNNVRTSSEEGQTKFSPHSHSQTQTQARQASACVAEPAAPSGDAPPPEAEAAASVVDEGGNGASPPKPKFGPATLVELWNGLGCKPTVSELTDERRKKAGLRLRKRGDPDWWRMLFEKARDLNKPFLNFDFLMRSDTNCLKVLEGNYDHDFGSRGDARGVRAASPQQRTPRGYDKRKDLYIVEVPDPS